MTFVNDSVNDNGNQNIENIINIHEEVEVDKNHSSEPTTMNETLALLLEMEDQLNKIDRDLEKSEKSSMNEQVARETLNRPPPYYSLTSPCLPPTSPQEEDWSLELPPSFDGHPPYPAGPSLLKVAYPKDIPGPTYACPQCEGTFLYYRPAGIVQCPFCHSSISIGRFVRIRACSLIMFGSLFLLSSIIFGLANKIFLDCSGPYFLVVGMISASGLMLLFRALHLCFRYQETERIEFA